MKQELLLRGLSLVSEFVIPIYYSVIIEADLRCDMLIENQIVVEFKAVNELDPVQEAQLLTFMKLMQKPKGILTNFNCSNLFKHGQQTYVNEYLSDLPVTQDKHVSHIKDVAFYVPMVRHEACVYTNV